MVDTNKLNILGIDELSSEKLTEVAIELKLETPRKKSSVKIRNELNHLVKLFLAGQVQTSFKKTSAFSSSKSLDRICYLRGLEVPSFI